MKKVTKDSFLKEMGNGIIIFEFIKKSTGDVRKMIGTRNFNVIPKEHYPKNSEKYHPTTNNNIVTVFDVENDGWRSFDVTTLTKIIKVLPNVVGTEVNKRKYEILNRLHEIQISREKFKNRIKQLKHERSKDFINKVTTAVQDARNKLTLEVKKLKKELVEF